MDLEYLGLSLGRNLNEMEGQILILCTRIASSMHRMSSTDGEETVSISYFISSCPCQLFFSAA